MSSKSYFDQVATQWDEMRQGFFSEAVRDRALAAVGVQAGTLAADIGAGTGFVTEGLIKAGMRVIAVDQSEAMLTEMKARLGDPDGVEYRVGGSERLPIDDNAVDYVFANMFLHHVEQPAEAIREMVRILKPGGKLVITDLDQHEFEFLRTEHHDRWMGFKRDEVRQWFAGAGLNAVIIADANSRCCADSACGAQSADVNIFVAAGEKPVKGDHEIHQIVRAHYGALARSASSCCSGGSASSCCDSQPALYDEKLLADLPNDVAEFSLGCGDPVTIAGLKPGEVVLDLGSGGGIDCFLAARQVGDQGHVIGVDMTPDMLAKANAAKERLGMANVEFRQGQIEALPVADNSVDVIMSNCVINLSPDKQAVFNEAFRVLKPGGRISVSDVVTQGGVLLVPDPDSWAACVAGAIDVNEYTGMMRAAGLVDVQVIDKTGEGDGPRVFSARITARKPM